MGAEVQTALEGGVVWHKESISSMLPEVIHHNIDITKTFPAALQSGEGSMDIFGTKRKGC